LRKLPGSGLRVISLPRSISLGKALHGVTNSQHAAFAMKPSRRCGHADLIEIKPHSWHKPQAA
jgi:hypothetical protein